MPSQCEGETGTQSRGVAADARAAARRAGLEDEERELPRRGRRAAHPQRRPDFSAVRRALARIRRAPRTTALSTIWPSSSTQTPTPWSRRRHSARLDAARPPVAQVWASTPGWSPARPPKYRWLPVPSGRGRLRRSRPRDQDRLGARYGKAEAASTHPYSPLLVVEIETKVIANVRQGSVRTHARTGA